MINIQCTTINEPLPDCIYEGLKSYLKNANTYHPPAGIDESIQIFAKAYGAHTHTFSPTYIEYTKRVTNLGFHILPSYINTILLKFPTIDQEHNSCSIWKIDRSQSVMEMEEVTSDSIIRLSA